MPQFLTCYAGKTRSPHRGVSVGSTGISTCDAPRTAPETSQPSVATRTPGLRGRAVQCTPSNSHPRGSLPVLSASASSVTLALFKWPRTELPVLLAHCLQPQQAVTIQQSQVPSDLCLFIFLLFFFPIIMDPCFSPALTPFALGGTGGPVPLVGVWGQVPQGPASWDSEQGPWVHLPSAAALWVHTATDQHHGRSLICSKKENLHINSAEFRRFSQGPT